MPVPLASITRRPIQESDREFLLSVYAGARAEELAAVPWDDGQKRAFLQMQFDAQHTHYQTHFPHASYCILEYNGAPIGRLYVDHRAAEIAVMDIALLPEYRNQGIGSALLREILIEAREDGRPVRLHVEHSNPALRLYERLGFTQRDDTGVYYQMEWRAK